MAHFSLSSPPCASAPSARQRYPLFMRWLTLLLIAVFPLLSCSLPGTASETYASLSFTQPYTPTTYVQPFVQGSYNSTAVHYVETDYVNTDIVVQSPTATTREVVILSPKGSSTGIIYMVERGDSFYKLAEFFCGDSRQYKHLLEINGQREGDLLEVGQQVLIECEEE